MDSIADRLQRLDWQPDRMRHGSLLFRLEHQRASTWELGEDAAFRFYKDKFLVEQYRAFWAQRADFRPRHVLELGIWYGGSAAFWFEMLCPDKLVAIDYAERRESAYFDRYVASAGLARRLQTHWRFDQADQRRLHRLVDDEFGGSLDLVLDDASHVYEPTKASFEALFPRLRPGGLYIIEDWAWAHWPEFVGPNSAFRLDREPTLLIWELTEAAGTSADIVASMTVTRGFVVVERGPAHLTDDFTLGKHIVRRGPDARRAGKHLRRWLGQRLKRTG